MVLGSENPTGEEPCWKRWFDLRLLVFRKALRRGASPTGEEGALDLLGGLGQGIEAALKESKVWGGEAGVSLLGGSRELEGKQFRVPAT